MCLFRLDWKLLEIPSSVSRYIYWQCDNFERVWSYLSLLGWKNLPGSAECVGGGTAARHKLSWGCQTVHSMQEQLVLCKYLHIHDFFYIVSPSHILLEAFRRCYVLMFILFAGSSLRSLSMQRSYPLPPEILRTNKIMPFVQEGLACIRFLWWWGQHWHWRIHAETSSTELI